MKKIILFLFVTLSVSFANGQSTVYNNPEFSNQPFKNIKVIALLPFITPVPTNNLNAAQLHQIQFNRGVEFQNDLFSYMLNTDYITNKKVQTIRMTNAELMKNHISIDSLAKYTPSEICKILKTDAILAGSISSESAYRRKGNIIHFVLSLYDKNNNLIWKFNSTESKSIRKSLDDIVKIILKKAMRQFPQEYRKEEKSKIKGLFSKKR